METLKYAFTSVKSLTITKMNYNWSDVQKCVHMFSSLEELSASFNIISILDDSLKYSTSMRIQTIMLEGNFLSSWTEILKLGSLPWYVDKTKYILSHLFIYYFNIIKFAV